MPESQTPSTNTLIYHFQEPIFTRLCAISRACLNVDRSALGMKLKACFLLIGPSGCGKTFLARALAEEMQVPFLSIAVSDWILIGASNRGGSATWPAIFDFVERSKQKQGAIIFVDELDKCSHNSNWNAFLRSEIFSLCDCRVPMSLNDVDGDNVTESRIRTVRDFLENKTMILAGAAFQHLWEDRSKRAIGYLPHDSPRDLPELPDLAKTLPRELVNRFSSEIFVLPELTKDDYRKMLECTAGKIEETWRRRFLDLGNSRLDEAVRHKKGVRFMEEVLLAAIVEERVHLTSFIPQAPRSGSITKVDGGGPELQLF